MDHVSNTEITIQKGYMHSIVFILPIIMTVILFVIWWGLGIIGLGFCIYAIMRWKTTYLEVTTKRLHGRYGIVQIHQIDSPLNKITDISIHQGIFGNMLGYGNIKILTVSGSFDFQMIVNPAELRDAILKAADDMEEGRFERQTRRYESAIHEQTMMQMQSVNHIANAITSTTDKKETDDKKRKNAEKQSAEINETSVVKEKKNFKLLWVENSPVLITKSTIKVSEEGKETALQLEIQNLEQEHLEAMYLDIQGFDMLKQEKCFLKDVMILDLDIACGECQVLPKMIVLPDPSIRRVKVYLKHAVYANDVIWDGITDKFFEEISDKSDFIEEIYKPEVDMLCEENGLSESYYQVSEKGCYPIFRKSYWICACGQFNLENECVKCHCSKDFIRQNFSHAEIERRYNERKEAERIKEEERQRLEEERIANEERMKREAEERRRERIENAMKIVGSAKEKVNDLKDNTVRQMEAFKTAVASNNEERQKEKKENKQKENGKICKNCGFLNDEDAVFCISCGKKLEEADSEENTIKN